MRDGPDTARIGPAAATAARIPAARGLKSGYALTMRTSDVEEAVNPLRSLEDLLSAAKPFLRNAARSPEPVWFSIQPVDLATLEDVLSADPARSASVGATSLARGCGGALCFA